MHRLLTRIFIAAAASPLVFLVSGCSDNTPKSIARAPITVQTVTMKAAPENIWVETLGLVEGVQQAEVRAQVSGILEKINYKEGDRVKAGDSLFQIDPAPYRAALDQATGTVREVRAQLAQQEREAQRYKKLWDARAGSKKDYDDALSAVHITRGQLTTALAAERNARIELDRTRVAAPSDGIVSRSLVNTGALISATETLLATITQPEKLRVTFSVSEGDLKGAQVTTDNDVRLRVNEADMIPAQLDYVSPMLESSSATLNLRATLDAPHGLRPGQYVHVQLQTKSLPEVFRVPQSAVLQKADGTYLVYRLEDGKARQVQVELGTWKDKDWIVLSGLRAGDQIITNQIQRLRDGSDVTVASSTSEPAAAAASSAAPASPAAAAAPAAASASGGQAKAPL